LAGESVDGVMLLNGNNKESLTAYRTPKDGASRARSSAAIKAGSVTDLSDFKRFIKTQCAIGLNTTNGKPRCDPAARKAIGNGLWARPCLRAAAVSSSGIVQNLHAEGEAAFVAEADVKSRVCWNQSGNSEAAKMKSAWFKAAEKRAAAGSAPGEPAAKRLPPAPAIVQTAGPDGDAQDGAVLNFAGALRERIHRATKTHITTQRAEYRRACLFCYWLAATAL
jgi:hypothetical protein